MPFGHSNVHQSGNFLSIESKTIVCVWVVDKKICSPRPWREAVRSRIPRERFGTPEPTEPGTPRARRRPIGIDGFSVGLSLRNPVNAHSLPPPSHRGDLKRRVPFPPGPQLRKAPRSPSRSSGQSQSQTPAPARITSLPGPHSRFSGHPDTRPCRRLRFRSWIWSRVRCRGILKNRRLCRRG